MNISFMIAQTYWKKENPAELNTFLIVIGVIILVIIVSKILKSTGIVKSPQKSISTNRKSSLLSTGAKTYSRGNFVRAARSRGITDNDIAFLEEYARSMKTVNPEFVFQNTQRLDSFFKDTFRHIEKHSDSEAGADERKSRLFGIREGITQRALMGPHINSTRQIERSTTLSFITPDETSHPSVVVAVEPGGIAVEPVLDAYGERVHLARGTKLSVFFYRKAHQGYSFNSKVRGYENTKGRLVMVIKHSDQISALPTRRNLRKDMNVPCIFQRVHIDIVKNSGVKTKNVVVEKMPFRGTIIDISAGGCSLQASTPLDAGSYAKIEFNAGEGSQSVIGTVIRSNQVRGGIIIHLRFVKIHRKAINAILSYVYGYVE